MNYISERSINYIFTTISRIGLKIVLPRAVILLMNVIAIKALCYLVSAMEQVIDFKNFYLMSRKRRRLAFSTSFVVIDCGVIGFSLLLINRYVIPRLIPQVFSKPFIFTIAAIGAVISFVCRVNNQFDGSRQFWSKKINDLELTLLLEEDAFKEIEIEHTKLFEKIKQYETALEMTHVDCPEKIKEKEKIALELEYANQELDENQKKFNESQNKLTKFKKIVSKWKAIYRQTT